KAQRCAPEPSVHIEIKLATLIDEVAAVTARHDRGTQSLVEHRVGLGVHVEPDVPALQRGLLCHFPALRLARRGTVTCWAKKPSKTVERSWLSIALRSARVALSIIRYRRKQLRETA